MRESQTEPSDPNIRRIVDAGADVWVRRLIDHSRANSLLFYRDLEVGTLDLGSPPDAVRRLLAGEALSVDALLPPSSGEIDDPLRRERVREKGSVGAALGEALQEEFPPPLTEIAKRLGCEVDLLRRTFPDLCQQVVEVRKALRTNRKVSLMASLRAALEEYPPPSLQEMSKRLGLSSRLLERLSPELSNQIANRSREYIREQTLKKESDLRKLVRNAVVVLNSRGVYPTINKISDLVDLRTQTYTSISKLVHELRVEFGLE